MHETTPKTTTPPVNPVEGRRKWNHPPPKIVKIFHFSDSFGDLTSEMAFFAKLRWSVRCILVFKVVDIAGIYNGVRPLVGGPK